MPRKDGTGSPRSRNSGGPVPAGPPAPGQARSGDAELERLERTWGPNAAATGTATRTVANPGRDRPALPEREHHVRAPKEREYTAEPRTATVAGAAERGRARVHRPGTTVTMRRPVPAAALLAIAVVAGLAGFAIGHATSAPGATNARVTVGGAPVGTVTSQPAGASGSAGGLPVGPATSQPAGASGSAGSSGSTGGGSGFDYASAVSKIASLGYSVTGRQSENGYPGPLAVLIATCTGSADGGCQHAFFFVDNRYIGTDTSRSDEQVDFEAQDGDTVTLSYPIFEPNDPLCCPTGGSRTVTFAWNGSKLVPLDDLPQNPNAP